MDRRSFLGTTLAAAGVGLGAATLTQRLEAKAQVVVAPGSVLDVIISQMETALARVQKGPDIEATRQFASTLHLYAAWARDHNLDRSFRQRLRVAKSVDVSLNVLEEMKLRGYTLPSGSTPLAKLQDIEDARQ